MTWEIKVWHENSADRAHLSIEAGLNVPDDVIADIVGSYWFEEVQTEEWDELEGYESGAEKGRLQG